MSSTTRAIKPTSDETYVKGWLEEAIKRYMSEFPGKKPDPRDGHEMILQEVYPDRVINIYVCIKGGTSYISGEGHMIHPERGHWVANLNGCKGQRVTYLNIGKPWQRRPANVVEREIAEGFDKPRASVKWLYEDHYRSAFNEFMMLG